MSTSLPFDRAAGIYDQTRPLFKPIARQGIQAILDIVGPKARILDTGAGTGRISIPLLERGANLTGCDLSAKMLQRFREKRPSAWLVQADATHLPFPRGQFDAVLTVHVMHLVNPWRDTLREFRRVLKPGGVYLNVRTWEPVGISVRDQVRDYWRRWVASHGFEGHHPGIQNHAELIQELQSMDAPMTVVEAVRYTHNYTLREELERIATRVYSDTWSLPDAILNASVDRLRTWIIDEYGSLDREVQDEVRFAIDVVHLRV